MYLIGLIEPYRAEIASVALTLVGALIRYLASPRSKIVYSKSHAFWYGLRGNEGDPSLAYTESLIFKNAGRKTATEIEVILGRRPQNFAIWPQRDYQTSQNPEGFFVLKTQNLAPSEHFTFNMLEVGNDPPILTNVRCADGPAKAINVAPAQVYSRWVNISAVALMFLGFCTSLYLVIKLLEYLTR